MFIPSDSGANVSTASGGGNSPTAPQQPSKLPEDRSRHLIFGTPAVVHANIRDLHSIGYAEPNDWSQPQSTGRANEVMVILTKRVNL